jgi:hypothetical protein
VVAVDRGGGAAKLSSESESHEEPISTSDELAGAASGVGARAAAGAAAAAVTAGAAATAATRAATGSATGSVARSAGENAIKLGSVSGPLPSRS